MKAKRPSRTNLIELDKCIAHFDSKFEMILAVARRTRSLQKNADPWGLMVTPIDALLEAQDGRLSRDHYLKPLNGQSAEDYYRGRLRSKPRKVVPVR